MRMSCVEPFTTISIAFPEVWLGGLTRLAVRRTKRPNFSSYSKFKKIGICSFKKCCCTLGLAVTHQSLYFLITLTGETKKSRRKRSCEHQQLPETSPPWSSYVFGLRHFTIPRR